MQTLWKYLKPQWRLALLALLLAAISQVLALVDPIIFGKLIDEVATQRGSRPNDELVRTALLLLALAVGVALLRARRGRCRTTPCAAWCSASARRSSTTACARPCA